MSSTVDRAPTWIGALPTDVTAGLPCVRSDGEGPTTSLLCGTFEIGGEAAVQLLIALICFSIPPLFLFPGRRRLMFLAVPLVISTTFASYYIAPIIYM